MASSQDVPRVDDSTTAEVEATLALEGDLPGDGVGLDLLSSDNLAVVLNGLVGELRVGSERKSMI